ncbi:2OG-Fe(II) oxygenase superfamily protein [Colwellia chukchiensis]|uniref:2OG-Fe(II) oxygenase superfamily protein n=1 Tax=Colwellia chukchiensis TaxID=641665 RepID=A0A1H7GE39_9GAMM|nr:2OG-Fe(II) oxygenase family protein [Colwellia chukchiensis]SEK36409.1 2OG-Fe(II) oxygenase superfamily protein [Colwellia chukchiensis]
MQWFEKLENNGFVQIAAFLPYQQARQLRTKIAQRGHFKQWNLLTTPYQPLSRIKDRISTKVIDNRRHVQAAQALQRQQFSFSFYRSSNKHAKQHGQAALHQDLGSKVVALLKAQGLVTGQLQDSFFASFKKGQFISYHSDGNAGKYAFIYQLSSGWQYQFGGQLELYPKKLKFFKHVLAPTFNTLTLLKLSHPMPHSVRVLNNPAHKHRITISGWVE